MEYWKQWNSQELRDWQGVADYETEEECEVEEAFEEEEEEYLPSYSTLSFHDFI